MKKVLYISLLIAAFLNFVSCGIHRQAAIPQQYDSRTVDQLSKLYGLRLTPTDNLSLYNTGSSWLGVKYRYGGNTRNGVDCSGLVCNLYLQVYGIKLERSTANIHRRNCVAINRNNLREGDLVFFKTSGSALSRIPTHVGLYLKNGKFIHASSSKGVIISSLSEPYYIRTWIAGGRVLRQGRL